VLKKLICSIFILSLLACSTAPKVDVDNLKHQAEAGDANAMFRLGVMHDGGQVLPADKKEAAKWYLKAALAGNAEAQNSIGSMYQAGDGVEKDFKKAAEWYGKAADQGHAPGIHNLAFLYDSGVLGKADKKLAIQKYMKSAQLGYIPSFINLGIAAANGDGVPKSKIEAFKWLELGRFYSQNTYPSNSPEHQHKWRVRGLLDQLKKEMNPQEISEGQKLAEAWSKNLSK
jgi:TPR repeat protein